MAAAQIDAREQQAGGGKGTGREAGRGNGAGAAGGKSWRLGGLLDKFWAGYKYRRLGLRGNFPVLLSSYARRRQLLRTRVPARRRRGRPAAALASRLPPLHARRPARRRRGQLPAARASRLRPARVAPPSCARDAASEQQLLQP